jgi:hypothetical protein
MQFTIPAVAPGSYEFRFMTQSPGDSFGTFRVRSNTVTIE